MSDDIDILLNTVGNKKTNFHITLLNKTREQ